MMADNPTTEPARDEKKQLSADGGSARKPFFNEHTVDLIGAGGSIIAGGVTAWQMIERDFHNNFSTLQLTKDLKDPRDKWGSDHVKNITGKGTKAISSDESARLIIEQSRRYQSDLSSRKIAAGFKTFFDRTRLIHPVQWGAIAITSLAVTSVAIGSLLLLTKDIFKSTPDKAKQDDKGHAAPLAQSFTAAEHVRSTAQENPASMAI